MAEQKILLSRKVERIQEQISETSDSDKVAKLKKEAKEAGFSDGSESESADSSDTETARMQIRRVQMLRREYFWTPQRS